MKSYSAAILTAQSRVPGPSPMPMARMVETPAARARAMTPARSGSKRGPSRWAWESMYMGEVSASKTDGYARIREFHVHNDSFFETNLEGHCIFANIADGTRCVGLEHSRTWTETGWLIIV